MNTIHISAGKLMPPSLAASSVLREAPCARICRASAPLTVIHAAAGFGKSTLMAQCRLALESSGTLTMWLTLDRADNDVPRLLNTLTRATEPLLDEPVRCLADLLEGLAQAREPWVLFLDEFEHLHEPVSLSVIRELIERLPRNGRLIVGSRCAPDLELARLRARSALLEIDDRELRFSVEEAAKLLGGKGAPMPDLQLQQVHARTEGWATALALLAQSRERGDFSDDLVAGLSGSEHDLAHYLGEEVFTQQPPELREFLLRTSVLHHLEPGLCQVLNPRLNGAQVLVRLADARIFVTPLDGDVPAWRYHRMFAGFLRARLARDMPDEALRLHLLAAGWYETQGRLAPAIDHAMEGEDWPLAITLLERAAEEFLEEGRFQMLARWFGGLPSSAIEDRPLLQTTHVWALCLTKGTAVAMQAITRYRLDHCAQPQVQAHLRALQPILLAMQDQYDRACEACDLAVTQRSAGSRFVDGLLGNVVAHVSFVMGRTFDAANMLEGLRPFGAFESMYRESTLGMMDLRDGRLRQATARFKLALEMGGSRPGYDPGNAWVGVLYAFTQYEAGFLDEADRLLNIYLPSARDIGLPDHMIGSYVMRSRIARSRGDFDAALQLLCELEHDGLRRELPRVAASANLERARLLLLQGHPEIAERALQRAAGLYPWDRARELALPAHETDDWVLVRIRAHLAADEIDAAEALIAREVTAAASRPRRRLTLHLLAAISAWTAGRTDEACALLRPLLHSCSREGYFQLLVEEGLTVLPMLRLCHAEIRNGPRSLRDPLLQDHIERMLAALGETNRPAAEHDSGDVQLAEMLTQKERSVLRLLSDGCSNQAIGDQLAISDSTVRTHLRSISQKLGSRGRAQSIAYARRLMLI